MMSLAQRVRDCRYSKGWGPDELASRAYISRTALYQIESGKTALPRAGTLRRIALALEVSMDCLLEHEEAKGLPAGPRARPRSAGRDLRGDKLWIPVGGGALATPTRRAALSSIDPGVFDCELETNGDSVQVPGYSKGQRE